MKVTLATPEQTVAFGARLAAHVVPGLHIHLLGELGAGKTTFTRGLVQALPGGERMRVKSPTYALAHSYATQPRVWHVDLYRLEDGSAVDTLGVFDGVLPSDVVLTEWADRSKAWMAEGLVVALTGEGEGPRTAELSARGALAGQVLAALGQ